MKNFFDKINTYSLVIDPQGLHINNSGYYTVNTVTSLPTNYILTANNIAVNTYPVIFNMDWTIDIDEEPPATIKKNKVGCKCVNCEEFFPYAEHPEDEDFKCYSCKMDW